MQLITMGGKTMFRARRFFTAGLLAGLILPAATRAQFNSELVGFNGPPIDQDSAHEMFQIPETSGSTATFIVPNDPNQPFAENNAFRSSFSPTEGVASLEVFFDWVDPNDPLAWLRLTTFNGAERPNPALHLGGKVRFTIINLGQVPPFPAVGEFGICLGIRETGQDVPQLADGGTAGHIEWVGVTGTTVIPNDPNDPNDDTLRPEPAITLSPDPNAVSLEWDLSTGHVFVNGVDMGGGIAGFTGDGTLSSPDPNVPRGTLEHIAITNLSGDPGVTMRFLIDELQFEAPDPDPVPPPTVISPIIQDDLIVTVTDLVPTVDQVNLLRNGMVILTENVTDPNDVEFDLTAPGAGGAAQTGETFSATQRDSVSNVTSPESFPVTVIEEPPPYGFSVLMDEDGDGSCTTGSNGIGWEFIGATSKTASGGNQIPEGMPLVTNNATWQTVELDFAGPITAWLGGDGTIDPSPSGFYTIDSLWFNLSSFGNVGPHVVYIDEIQALDANDAVIQTIHDFEDGVNYMRSARGQSAVEFGFSSGLSTATSFEGATSHRLEWSFDDPVLGPGESFGILTRTTGCGTQPPFPDATRKLRLHMLLLSDPPVPLGACGPLEVPVVVGPIVGMQDSVRILNDPNASAVQVYINGIALDPNQGGVIDPMGASEVDFLGLPITTGDSISARQTLGGVDSDFALPRVLVTAPAPPQGDPNQPASTGEMSVTVTNVLDVPFAEASLVTVKVNDGMKETATEVPSGDTVVVDLVNTLATGDTVTVSQTVNGVQSADSEPLEVLFAPAPVIYAAPAVGDATVRVQGLIGTTDSVTIQVFDPNDPNTILNSMTTPVAPGSSFVDAALPAGLVAGDVIDAIQSVGVESSARSEFEFVTVNTTTAVLSDDFEVDQATFDANWTATAGSGLSLSTDRNSTVGGQKSAFNFGDSGRIEQLFTQIAPTATDPLVWNVNIFDSAGPGAGGANQFAQIIDLTDEFYLIHVGISNLASDTDFYQFRAVGHSGPNWIDLNQLPDAPLRSIGWHTFTVIQKGDRIDVYVDGILSAKNITLSGPATLENARIGPGVGNNIPGYYDDYVIELGKVNFGSIAPQPPATPRIDAPIQDGDQAVRVSDLLRIVRQPDPVTLVEVIDQGMNVIGSTAVADPNADAVDVNLNRSLVHLERITARASNVIGSSTSDPLEVGVGNGDLLLALGVRETDDTLPLGCPGSTGGDIEWVGATFDPNAENSPQGVVAISPSDMWQTVTFDPNGPIAGFAGDPNTLGTITATRGTLEHLAITVNAASADRSSGPYFLFVDNVVNVGAGSGGSDVVIADFEGLPLGAEALFQEPTLSGSTDQHLAPLPSASEVTADFGNPGQSELLTWFFRDTEPERWIRLTTFNANNLPAPIIDLTKPIRMDVLLVEAICDCPGNVSDIADPNNVVCDTDLDDLTVVLQNYLGSNVPSPGGDIDGDGDTDLDDLTLLLQDFGCEDLN